MVVKNPQYPHRCTIYRYEGATQFEEGEKVVLYEGKCRKEGDPSIRNSYSDNVPKGDYRVSIPGFQEGMYSGDFIDVTDRVATYSGLLLTDVHISNFGTEVFFNLPKN